MIPYPHEVVLSDDWTYLSTTVRFNLVDRTFDTGYIDMSTSNDIEDGKYSPLPLDRVDSDVKEAVVGWLFHCPKYDMAERAHAKFLSMMAPSIEGNG